MTPSEVEIMSKPPAAPATPATPAAPATKSKTPDTISKNPVFVAVLLGQIPGVLVPGDRVYPSTVNLGENPDDLGAVGLGLYVTAQQDATVVYNPQKITPEELQAADLQGKLAEILPEYGALSGESPEPIGPTGSLEEGLAATGAPSPMLPSSMIAPAPSKVSAGLSKARAKNASPGGPTSGPKPGAGRVANTMALPVI